MKIVWKRCKAWLFTTVSVLLFLVIVALVVTQNTFLYGTMKTLWGGERRVLVSGDATKYQYYKIDNAEFEQFQPEEEKIDTKAKALKEANRLNTEIAEEGFVLLKNENSALPIDTPQSKTNKAAAKPKVSVFGKNSVSMVYGGSGSGGGNAKDSVNLYGALEAAGFEYNTQLKKFYESGSSGSGRSENPAMGTQTYGLRTGETEIDKYSSKLISSYSDYNDAAIIVFSRIGGEGFDLPRTMLTGSEGKALAGSNEGDHYLELDNNEKALIKHVTESEANFKRVIVVINCATSMELGFIKDDANIDAAVWIGSPGGSGLTALGNILNGNVNPSGRLVDTYAKDFTKDPSWNNIGNNNVKDGNRYSVGGAKADYYFVEYEEGIYEGYRYYETRAYQDWYDMKINTVEEWYDEAVVYPFGYGLSYSDFTQEIISSTPAANTVLNTGAEITTDTIEVTVKVTNNGTRPGKDVVQLYYSPEYKMYDNRQIQKSFVVLGDYVKTPMIEPNGGTQTVTLKLNVKDMASFDYDDANGNGVKGYELEAGKYGIYVGANAHCWADNLAGDDYAPDLKFTVSETIFTDETVKPLFEDVSNHIQSYLARNNFDNFTTTPTASELEVSAAFANAFKYDQKAFDEAFGAEYLQTQAPTTGWKPKDGEKAYKLYDLIDFNEETGEFKLKEGEEAEAIWKNILDQLTVDEMRNLIGTGNFNTMYIESIDKPKTTDPDGPAGFTNFMGDPTVYDTCFYASECVVGATFNRALAHDMGVMVGIEGNVGDVRGDGRPYSGWYAPAVNIHRSPFSGRNWEYYSEDPLLSGKMGASVVKGAKSMGVYTYVKHFAVNDQETNRDSNGLVVWLNEQALREIYLKPFEIIVKEGGTNAIMSSFNRIGATWAGGNYHLLTDVLRKEWGFKGMVITDYNLQSDGYMSPNQMLRAGGDLNLVQGGLPAAPSGENAATQTYLLRRATQNILYTVVQSNAMNGMGEGNVWGYALPTWVIIMTVIIVVIAVGFGVWGFFAIRGALKKEKLQAAEATATTEGENHAEQE